MDPADPSPATPVQLKLFELDDPEPREEDLDADSRPEGG